MRDGTRMLAVITTRIEGSGRRLPMSGVDTVTRRVARTTSDLQRVLVDRTYLQAGLARPLDSDGGLRLDGPFAPSDEWAVLNWRTTGRLYPLTPLVAVYARVIVDISEWTARDSLLSLRPRSRRVARWSAYRQGRYFSLAHDAADRLADMLVRGAREPFVEAGLSLFAPHEAVEWAAR